MRRKTLHTRHETHKINRNNYGEYDRLMVYEMAMKTTFKEQREKKKRNKKYTDKKHDSEDIYKNPIQHKKHNR